MNMDRATALKLRTNRPGRGIMAWLGLAFTLKRHRRALGQLDRHLLKDIGLSETEAQIEADRSLWDVPATWRR